MDIPDMTPTENGNNYATIDYLHSFGKSLVAEFSGKLAETQSAIMTALAAQLQNFQTQQGERQERFRAELAQTNRGKPTLWAAIVGLILTLIMMAGTAFGTLHLASLRREMDHIDNQILRNSDRQETELRQLEERLEIFQGRYIERLEAEADFYRDKD